MQNGNLLEVRIDLEIGKSRTGTINFLFQLNNKKKYLLKNKENNEDIAGIYCRADCGPCFGNLGKDIYIPSNFLDKEGLLHKDKEVGRYCSYDYKYDYELYNGERTFKLVELEAFLLYK